MTDQRVFYEQADAILDWVMKESPGSATALGEHRYDHLLDDLSLDAQTRRNEATKQYLTALREMDTASFDLDAQVDHAIVETILRRSVYDFENRRPHIINPASYIQVALYAPFMLTMREFAPMPERLKSAAGRLNYVPDVLAAGQANINPKSVPRVWAEVAAEQAASGEALFGGLFPMLAESVPEIKEELIKASQAALQAIQTYKGWLQDTVIPQASGNFAAGAEVFDDILYHDHMVDYTVKELDAIGWQLYNDTWAQMETAAEEIRPGASVDEALDIANAEHVPWEELLDAYRRAIGGTRQWIIEHEVVSMPEGETLRIEETPVFDRSIIPYAAYNVPGPLEAKQEGLYWVTPVDPNLPEEVFREKFKQHSNASIAVVSIHEGYPGHHLQFAYANTVGTLPRKLGGAVSTLFSEGWAFYCEQLMEDLGYLKTPFERLVRLQNQLWRAARIIVDAGLHTGKMSVEEATRFMTERAKLEAGDALAEVRRYTFEPTQPQSYLMGKMELLKIVEAYKAKYPRTSLRKMHDAILGCGSVPPRLMRRLLGV